MPASDHDTPVLVGVGAVRHRPEDGPVPSLVELMVEAVRRAGADAGPAELLGDIGWIGVPKGAWTHPDPGREVAAAFGSPGAHTVLAEVGVLQQEVIDRACRSVSDGHHRVAVVLGAEVAHASTDGVAGSVVNARSAVSEPDEHVVSQDLGVSPLEVARGLYDPPTVYAVLESAWAHAQGWDREEHLRRLGDLWSGFAAVAASNPVAWRTDAPGPEAIVEPSADNRMIAWPYTKLCCSNLRVNQAAALVFTSLGNVARLDIPSTRLVFPRGSAICNNAVPVVQRPDIARSPVAAAAVQRALTIAGVDASDLGPVDLYSCFPAAVQIAAHEIGLSPDRPRTLTGGMTFGGGPLNSYSLHSTVAMAGALRAARDEVGLVTSVSGFLTKYGAAVWSNRSPTEPWRSDDTTAEVAATDQRRPERAAESGDLLAVLGATVEHTRDGSRTVVAVGDLATGERTIVRTTDDGAVEAGLADELVGSKLRAP